MYTVRTDLQEAADASRFPLQHIATHHDTPQYFNALQHTATHCKIHVYTAHVDLQEVANASRFPHHELQRIL